MIFNLSAKHFTEWLADWMAFNLANFQMADFNLTECSTW